MNFEDCLGREETCTKEDKGSDEERVQQNIYKDAQHHSQDKLTKMETPHLSDRPKAKSLILHHVGTV